MSYNSFPGWVDMHSFPLWTGRKVETLLPLQAELYFTSGVRLGNGAVLTINVGESGLAIGGFLASHSPSPPSVCWQLKQPLTALLTVTMYLGRTGCLQVFSHFIHLHKLGWTLGFFFFNEAISFPGDHYSNNRGGQGESPNQRNCTLNQKYLYVIRSIFPSKEKRTVEKNGKVVILDELFTYPVPSPSLFLSLSLTHSCWH